MAKTNKPRPAPLLEELGGKEWVQSLRVRVDDKAGWGPMGTAALARDVDLPNANRVLVVRDREGGYRIEYWRIDADEADRVAEKRVNTIEEVKAELVKQFAG